MTTSPSTQKPRSRKAKTGRQHTATRADIYQQVTDRIVAAIEKGTLPWRKPWRSTRHNHASVFPVNALTGRPYSGVNVLLLWLAAEEAGYQSDRWLTYRQALEAGGHVRAGETASQAVLFKSLERQSQDAAGNVVYNDDGTEATEIIPMLKAFQVFNVAQCEGLPASVTGSQPTEFTEDALDFTRVNAQTQRQVMQMLDVCGVRVESRPQNRAFYSMARELIVLPMPTQFETEADYWSTLLHELTHATGHASRLNREGITSVSRRFGDPVYAFEELVAEMGSAFLCAQLGVFGDVQHDSYLAGWLMVLKSDKRALFRASRQAREASEFLLTSVTEAIPVTVAQQE